MWNIYAQDVQLTQTDKENFIQFERCNAGFSGNDWILSGSLSLFRKYSEVFNMLFYLYLFHNNNCFIWKGSLKVSPPLVSDLHDTFTQTSNHNIFQTEQHFSLMKINILQEINWVYFFLVSSTSCVR